MERFILICNLVIMSAGALGSQSHISSLIRKQREMNDGTQAPTHGSVLQPARGLFLSHLNLSGNNFTDTQKYVSMVILNAIKLAMKMNLQSRLRGLITSSPTTNCKEDLESQER